ncbi:hypothetical protein Tco_0034887 [Tanacetum coccineum]
MQGNMDDVVFFDITKPSDSLIALGSDIFYDDASGQSLLQAIEDNNIVVLVTDTADTSQLPSIVCSSGLSNHSKVYYTKPKHYSLARIKMLVEV